MILGHFSNIINVTTCHILQRSTMKALVNHQSAARVFEFESVLDLDEKVRAFLVCRLVYCLFFFFFEK